VTRTILLAAFVALGAYFWRAPQGGTAAGAAISLVDTFATAEKRPDTGANAIAVREVAIGGSARRTIVAPPVSRIVWPIAIPRNAELRVGLAVESAASRPSGTVVFRIGVADDRTYEQLFQRRVEASASTAWIEAVVDLGAYAGFQWSLFYWPDGRNWSVIFNTNRPPRAGDGGSLRALWGEPAVRTVNR
jgi:hypothetical protein